MATSEPVLPVLPVPPVPNETIAVSPISRGRMRPRGSRRELYAWYLMRVTGVALFVLALAHFSILHFIWDPAEQTAEFIANERWNQIFWRGFDWLLLMSVLFHGFLGMRTVVQDYIKRPRLREFTLIILYTLALLLLVIGTQVILTLPTRGA
ncbi:MAG: succinate dehydrogenase, hydrophobic membrane anchor protein [Candidatus Limnocylindrales bacterium]